MKSNLDSVKDYLRIEDNDEDVQILSLIQASKLYLKNAGVPEREDDELYNLVIKMLVSSMYENKSSGNPSFCLSLQSLITQLTCSGGSKDENKP